MVGFRHGSDVDQVYSYSYEFCVSFVVAISGMCSMETDAPN